MALTGAHSQHPDFYAKESGIVYELQGKIVEGKIMTTKNSYSTVFPDNWNAEKITSEVERIIEKRTQDIINEPRQHTLVEKETGGNFKIEVKVNVKANGKIEIATVYPIVK